MSDLDLRLVRYFVAVAEHRHFGRAAAALHITQPSLSRQIRALEHQVGARLLDRTPRGTDLTEAGEAFRPLAAALLRNADRAVATARAAAEPSRITVGYTNVLVTDAVRELRRLHPDAEVHTLHVPYDEPRTALLDRRVDVVVGRLPFATDDLDVIVLYDERRMLLVRDDHRLAGKESVDIDDIADEPLPRLAQDSAWNAFWRVDPRPDGRPAPGGPVVEAIEDKFEVIAAGEAVAIIPDVGRQPGGRPGLVTIALTGVEPSHVAMATRTGDRRPLVTAARRILRAYLKPLSSAA